MTRADAPDRSRCWRPPSWSLLGFPQLVNDYWLSVGITALFYAIVAASWALLVGYAGQFSFGHMAFVSIGAYTSGMLARYFGVPIPLGIPLGVVACAIVGCAIGYICLRMRGPYLALFTVAFSEVLRIVLVSEAEVTGGSGGLEIPTHVPGPLGPAVLLSSASRCSRSRWR